MSPDAANDVADSKIVLDSMQVVRDRGNVTLSNEEYADLAELAADEVRRLCLDLSLWNVYSSKDGTEIFERKNSLSHAKESMLLLVTTLPCTMEKLEKLLTPWLEYRLKWDDMLEDAQVIESWPEKEIYFVRHLVKKMFPMSARDSLDLVKVARGDNEVVFGSTGAVHGKYPPTKAYVRTHQYVGGYMLRPSDSDPAHTKFSMLFHADLNLSGPRLLTNLAGKFKPKFMLQKIENLKAAIAKFDT